MTTVDGKHFGNRLREARVQAGFSQSELEDLSGIPKARLSRYENGHVEPSIQTLARLARALNVSEASLLGDQRATLEGFFDVLSSRGVQIESAEQGVRLANAVADMVNALGGMGSFGADDDVTHELTAGDETAPMPWVDAPAGASAGASARRHLLTHGDPTTATTERMDVTIDGVTVVDLEVHVRRSRFVRRVLSGSWVPADRPALQGNISRSTAGSLRAMHFHRRQWDYWFVVSGDAFVALVDLRAGSPTERVTSTMRLSGETPRGLFIPPGVAHGFLAETDLTLEYLVDRYFDGTDEWGVAWNDPELGIDWPAVDPDRCPTGIGATQASPRRSRTRFRIGSALG